MKFKSTTNLGEIAPRLAFIDNSKGIAIIFVVIGHVVYHCICGKTIVWHILTPSSFSCNHFICHCLSF